MDDLINEMNNLNIGSNDHDIIISLIKELQYFAEPCVEELIYLLNSDVNIYKSYTIIIFGFILENILKNNQIRNLDNKRINEILWISKYLMREDFDLLDISVINNTSDNAGDKEYVYQLFKKIYIYFHNYDEIYDDTEDLINHIYSTNICMNDITKFNKLYKKYIYSVVRH